MKKRHSILNTIMAAFVGVFIGHTVYVVWNYKTHPGLYAMQAAPWYTSILVYGGFTLAVLAICLLIKLLLKYHGKKSDKKSNGPAM